MKPSKLNAYIFIIPSLFLTLVFGIYPLLWALRYMFYDYQGIGKPVFIGLDNFARIMRDGQFWDSVKNTGIYALGKLVITIPLSLILAIVFFIIFNSYNGILNQLLQCNDSAARTCDADDYYARHHHSA